MRRTVMAAMCGVSGGAILFSYVASTKGGTSQLVLGGSTPNGAGIGTTGQPGSSASSPGSLTPSGELSWGPSGSLPPSSAAASGSSPAVGFTSPIASPTRGGSGTTTSPTKAPTGGSKTSTTKPSTKKPTTKKPTTKQPTNGSSSGLKDGSYTGSAVSHTFGTVQVKIVVSNGKITSADAIQAPSGESQSFTDMSVPTLNKEAVAAQSADIAGVSGATLTSNAYKKSLQAAIDKAKG